MLILFLFLSLLAGEAVAQIGIQQPAHVYGAFATDDCAKINSAGFIVSNGGACGGGGGTPGGSNTQIQFNNMGAFGGSTLTYNGTLITATQGKITLQDATAVTGYSVLELRAGAAQAGITGKERFLGVACNTGAYWCSEIDAGGAFAVFDGTVSSKKKASLAAAEAFIMGGDSIPGILFSSDGTIRWKSVDNIDAAGTYDSGLNRESAGVTKITNGSTGLGSGHAAALTADSGLNYCASSTGSDTYACTVTPAPVSYVAGVCYTFYPSATSNTGAATLNINSLGAKSIKTSGGVDPGDGVIAAGSIYQLCYDGTNFLLPQDLQGTGVTTVSLTGSNSLNGKYVFQKITLTGNTTISSITNIKNGVIYGFIICQDGTGGWTFTWPASVLGGMTIGGTLSKCSTQFFLSDGTSLYASTPGVINQ